MNLQKILVVDDTAINIEILNELLNETYDVLSALDGEFAIEIAREDKPDLILLDIMMPNMDGLEVCRRLKNIKETKDIPIIFITAKTDEKSIEEAYEIGGTDYITKPFKPKELLAKVKKELKLRKIVNELKLLASTDSLTKLYNRRYFIQTAEHTFALAKRDAKHLSTIMIDIDKFKNVNDTYGHQVGDSVIVELANMLLANQRKEDIVCRYGGEEFVILLPNTSLDEAKIVAEKLRRSVEDLTFKLPSGEVLKFTISLGVSQVDTQKHENIEFSLKEADDALYRAKKSGRNRVCISQ